MSAATTAQPSTSARPGTLTSSRCYLRHAAPHSDKRPPLQWPRLQRTVASPRGESRAASSDRERIFSLRFLFGSGATRAPEPPREPLRCRFISKKYLLVRPRGRVRKGRRIETAAPEDAAVSKVAVAGRSKQAAGTEVEVENAAVEGRETKWRRDENAAGRSRRLGTRSGRTTSGRRAPFGRADPKPPGKMLLHLWTPRVDLDLVR